MPVERADEGDRRERIVFERFIELFQVEEMFFAAFCSRSELAEIARRLMVEGE